MRMGIGLGVGINRSNYAQGIFNAYQSRVIADGGITEAGNCVDAVSSLLQSASLLLIPSGYKGGKLYSEIPTNGNGDLTWTRGSDAFRTNASGLIQRVPWNLVQRSEEFDNATWFKTGSSISTNTTTAPNGTTTADSIIENTSNSTHLSYNASAISAISGAYTFSVYMKKNTRTYGFVQIATDTASKRYTIVVDLNSGSVTSTTSSGSPINPSNTITNVGDGWYRISVTATNTSGGLYGIFGLSDSATPTYTATAEPTYTGNGTSGLYIWGAQLVEGTTAQTYLPTTDRLNFPRLSYMYGSCPAVLLEPQRTNVLTYSNDFTNAIWVKDNSGATNPVVTANYATSPDGSNNASRLQLNKTGGVFSRIKQSVTTSGVYTFTVWMKSNTGANQNVGIRLEGTGINCVVTTSWQRFQITTTVAISAESQILLYDLISGNDETADILIYGAQTELGAYPTTYIPTTTATATRVADSFSRSNIYTNGLISASGGTWFVELRNNIVYTRDGSGFIGIGDTSALTTNSLVIFCPSTSSRLQIAKFIATVGTTLYTTLTDTVKIAIKWNGTTADVFVNGTKQVSATAFTTTNMEFLQSSIQVPTFIQQMELFPEPLTDAKLIELTTL